MARSEQNTGFSCAQCGRQVRPLTNGSYRNHCPFCLWSRHVDRTPGDRAHPCRGQMEPIDLQRPKEGWQLIHRCRACGARRVNRAAARTDQPDQIERLQALMAAGEPQSALHPRRAGPPVRRGRSRW